MGVVLDASGEMVRRLVQSAPLVGGLRERAQALGAELDLMVAAMAVTPAKSESASGPESAQEPAPADDGATDANSRAGTERARLVVLNMALGGSSREEAERLLREDFDIDGRDEILDEAFGTQDDGA